MSSVHKLTYLIHSYGISLFCIKVYFFLKIALLKKSSKKFRLFSDHTVKSKKNTISFNRMSWNVSHNLQICLPFVFSLVYPASIFAPFFTVTLALSLPYSLLYICNEKIIIQEKVKKQRKRKHADQENVMVTVEGIID